MAEANRNTYDLSDGIPAKVRGIGDYNPANLFRLARELKWAGYKPDAVELAAAGFGRACHPLGIDPDAAVQDLAAMWEDVASTRECNTFATAARLANNDWRNFTVWGVDGDLAKLLALTYWLSVLADQDFVAVPCANIAKWLGLSRETTGKKLRELAGRGLIRFRDGGAYSYRGGQAREAEFVGLGQAAGRAESAPSGASDPREGGQVFELAWGPPQSKDGKPVTPDCRRTAAEGMPRSDRRKGRPPGIDPGGFGVEKTAA